MKLYVAGGCSEHGRNCYYITDEQVSFLVDAGVMKEHPDRRWPALDPEMIRKADYLFLTHCHTDHTGAIPWLYDHGFKGKIVASKATVKTTPRKLRDFIYLEDLGTNREEISLGPLSIRWGRSGHCIGSVWFRFEIAGKSIFFSGDYQENTYAYECDEVRGMTADLAVLDCAYGTEPEDALIHRADLEKHLDELKKTGMPMLFPVPSHGRGTDLLQLLAERSVCVVVGESIYQEFLNQDHREFWLRKEFLSSVEGLQVRSYEQFEKRLEEEKTRGGFPEEYRSAGILVRDSQLYDGNHQMAAMEVIRAGGTVVLTGKQDPASFARKLLDAKQASFCRISVHQNSTEFRKLADRNHFTHIVPCHCRQELMFSESDVIILKPEDTYNV